MTDEEPVALITGGSRGLGKAIALRLSSSGWKVAVTYVSSQAAVQEMKNQSREKQKIVEAFQADVRDYARAQEIVSLVEKSLGPVRLLVNNAGVRNDRPLFRMKADQWHEVIDTNLGGTFNYSRAVIYGMIRRKAGVIVNITSVSGIMGLPGQTNYAASKAGVIGFTKALAREVARFNVRVNAVAPGLIETDMTESMPDEARTKILDQVPMGRAGTPKQVADLVSFLAGSEAEYITGKVIPIDGGLL